MNKTICKETLDIGNRTACAVFNREYYADADTCCRDHGMKLFRINSTEDRRKIYALVEWLYGKGSGSKMWIEAINGSACSYLYDGTKNLGLKSPCAENLTSFCQIIRTRELNFYFFYLLFSSVSDYM